MNTIITITNFITSLGSTVMLPIIILILGLILKMKLSKAIVSALTIGVGFVGLGLIIRTCAATVALRGGNGAEAVSASPRRESAMFLQSF